MAVTDSHEPERHVLIVKIRLSLPNTVGFGDALAVPIALRTVADALGAFDLPPCVTPSTDPRPAAGSIDPIIVYLL